MSTPLAGFEPAIPASEWQQTHALYRAATRLDWSYLGLSTEHFDITWLHFVLQKDWGVHNGKKMWYFEGSAVR
jgi:hypothetical protein